MFGINYGLINHLELNDKFTETHNCSKPFSLNIGTIGNNIHDSKIDSLTKAVSYAETLIRLVLNHKCKINKLIPS